MGIDIADVLTAQIAILEAKNDWQAGTAPVKIMAGPLTPQAAWPVIAVMAIEGDDGVNDLAQDLERQTVYWTVEIPVVPDGTNNQYLTLLAIDKQLRDLIKANPRWGLDDDVEDTDLRGWTTGIDTQENSKDLLQTLTRRMEVRTYE